MEKTQVKARMLFESRYSDCPGCGHGKSPWQEYCYDCQSAVNSSIVAAKQRITQADLHAIGSRIYAISVAGMETAPVKIGRTTDIATRIGVMQTGSPLRLELLAIDFGTRGNERFIHRALKSYRTHGEWFERNDIVVSLVEAMKAKKLAEWVDLAKSNQRGVG